MVYDKTLKLDFGDAGPELEPDPPKPEPVAVPFTWSEQYRHECEARYVAALDPDHAKLYLAGVGRWRGFEAERRLRISAGALDATTRGR